MAEAALAGRQVLVTGATGFIGRRLVPALIAAGAAVTVLCRSRPGADFAGLPVRVLRGALTDAAAVGAAVAGQDVIFNLAYDVRAPGSANVAAAGCLFAAAEAAARARIVHLSSIVVYDGWPGGALTEASPCDRPGGGAYRQAKIAIEHRLATGTRPAVILQPTIVWGPGSGLWTDRFADALLSGSVAVPVPEGLCQGVFVEDVVQACLGAASFTGAGAHRFIINGPAPFGWSALLNGYGAILGRGQVRPVPADQLRPATAAADAPERPPSAAARVSALGRRILGRARFEALVASCRQIAGQVAGRVAGRGGAAGGELRPDAAMFAMMVAQGHCPPDAARLRLGYRPAYDLDRGLAATAGYLVARARGRGRGRGESPR